jgi:hypothetical protein
MISGKKGLVMSGSTMATILVCRTFRLRAISLGK